MLNTLCSLNLSSLHSPLPCQHPVPARSHVCCPHHQRAHHIVVAQACGEGSDGIGPRLNQPRPLLFGAHLSNVTRWCGRFLLLFPTAQFALPRPAATRFPELWPCGAATQQQHTTQQLGERTGHAQPCVSVSTTCAVVGCAPCVPKQQPVKQRRADEEPRGLTRCLKGEGSWLQMQLSVGACESNDSEMALHPDVQV